MKWRNGNYVALLYAQWKLERYKAKGFDGFIHHGIFPADGLWEVYIFPKTKRHGDFIT